MSALATALADAKRAATMIEPALSLALLAQGLTGVGGPGAEQALKILDAAVKALEAGADGTLSAAQASERIGALTSALAANDAAADAADRARWPAG